MHAESYLKFYAIVVFSLIAGFLTMEFIGETGGVTANVVHDLEVVKIGMLGASGDMVFMLMGVVIGAILFGTLIHLYHSDNR